MSRWLATPATQATRPFQARESAAYGALTRIHPRLRLAGRIFERVVETRAQQDSRAALAEPRLRADRPGSQA